MSVECGLHDVMEDFFDLELAGDLKICTRTASFSEKRPALVCQETNRLRAAGVDA